jgi:hypothetical protein
MQASNHAPTSLNIEIHLENNTQQSTYPEDILRFCPAFTGDEGCFGVSAILSGVIGSTAASGGAFDAAPADNPLTFGVVAGVGAAPLTLGTYFWYPFTLGVEGAAVGADAETAIRDPHLVSTKHKKARSKINTHVASNGS